MKHILTLSVILCVALSLVSCKNGKQAKQIINVVKNEYKALNESSAYKNAKARLRYERAKEYINSSYTYSICSTCNGYGMLYLADEYGNAVTDYNGNFTFVECEDCRGNGYVED